MYDSEYLQPKYIEQSLSETVQSKLFYLGGASNSIKEYNPAPSILGEMILRLNYISELKDGWDGEEATKIAPEVIEKAGAILGLSRYPLYIAPTARGSVQIEYTSKSRYAEMEIFSDNVEVLAVKENKQYRAEGKESNRIEYFFNFINNE